MWNIEKGLSATGAEMARAEAQRVAIMGNMAQFFEEFNLLLCPALPPSCPRSFDVEVRFVMEVAGHGFDNYVHWLAITFAITLTACLPFGV